uniref:hypothetical protein n=1 Tax=uncultured Polaribacter sp. TaxID=174711 RepID=UPI002609C2FF|nr:hypothetical protein [uncultured Polaribacter sp.]
MKINVIAHEAKIDFERITSFLIIFILPLVLFKKRIFYNAKVAHRFCVLALIYTLLTTTSLFIAGSGKSAFPGNFFGATTVSLTLVSVFSFFGLFYYTEYEKKIGLALCILAYIACLASLAKWNFIVDIMIPFLLYKSWKRRVGKNFSKKILLYVGLFIGLTVLMAKSDTFLTKFAKLNDYDTFQDFLNGRVLRAKTSSSNIDSGIVFEISADGGVKDGARLAMWSDLISRTIDSPLTGLGLGARAFDYKKIYIEEHSLFFFSIAKFGFFLGFLFIAYIIKVFSAFYHIIRVNSKNSLSKIIFLGMILNFLFQSNVGNIWGQSIINLGLGLVIYFFMKPKNIIKSTY